MSFSTCPIPNSAGPIGASGPVDAAILLIGEAGGRVEGQKHQPFYPDAPAGAELDRLLQVAKLDRDNCRIGNTVDCSPPRDWLVGAPWEERALKHCSLQLDALLAEPHKVVVPLGGTALRAVMRLPRARGKEAAHVEDFHGAPVWDSRGFWIVPTFHPSFNLRSARKYTLCMNFDLTTARELAEGSWNLDEPELVMDPPPEWVERWVNEYLRDPWNALLDSDIETPDKARSTDESELGKEDKSYEILYMNFACNRQQGITFPWVEPYITYAKRAIEEGGPIAFHNADYDVRRIRARGIRIEQHRIHDSMNAWHVLYSSHPRGLGYVAPFFSHRGPWKHLGSHSPVYRALDGVQGWRVMTGCLDELRRTGMLPVYERHMHAYDTYVLKPAEEEGLGFSRPRLAEFSSRMEAICLGLESEISSLIPAEVLSNPLLMDGPYVKEISSDDPGAVLRRDEPTLIQACTACGAKQVSKKHRCEDRGLTPQVELAEHVVPRWWRRKAFNPSSWQQVLAVILAKGHKPGKDRKSKEDTTDKKTLMRLVKTGDPFYSLLLDHRRAKKMRGLGDGTVARLDILDRVHGTATHVPSTFRLCVATGTPIEVVRDVSAFPKGIPIEDVRPGDLAYTFDAQKNLVLRPVVWAGKTGRKAVVRVHWMSLWGGSKKSGYVDLTPEHEVRTTSGDYIQARLLAPGDRVLSLARGTNLGYARLWPTGHEEIQKEHRFIFQQVHGYYPEVVHHRNENKLDNRVSNLEPTSNSEHARHHSTNPSPERRANMSKAVKKRWADGTLKARSGAANGHWLGLPKEWMLKVLWENAGKPTTFHDLYGIDFDTAKKYLALHEIDVRAIAACFNGRDQRITRELVEEGRTVHKLHGQSAAQKHVGLGYYRWKAVQEAEGFVPYNHMVTSVEVLDELVDVYDLEVADTHNFIAGEICVHNSWVDPNLQNVASHVKYASEFRRAVVAGPGCRLMSFDYSGIEAVQVGYFSGDPAYIRLAKLGVHAFVESNMLFHITKQIGEPASLAWSDSDLKEHFKEIKGRFPAEYDQSKRVVHGYNYGLTEYGLSETYPDLFPKRTLAKRLIDLYVAVCPKLAPWQAKVRELAHRQKYLGGPGTHPFGYKHWFFSVLSYRKYKSTWIEALGDDAKKAVAFFPQSAAAGTIAEAALALFEDPNSPNWIGDAGPGGRTPLRAIIHDDLTFEVRDEMADFLRAAVIAEMTKGIEEMPCPEEWGLGAYLTVGVAAKEGLNWAPAGEGNPEGMRGVESVADDSFYEDEDDEDIL